MALRTTLANDSCPAFSKRRNSIAGTALGATTAVAWLLAPATSHAVNRTWDGGASGTGTSWTATTGANWNPNGLPTTADNLTLDNSIVTVPTVMTIATSDIGALTITFSNNFNPTNTTVIGDGGTGNRILTLGTAASPWSLINNATSGNVTFQPQSTASDGFLSFRIANNGTMTAATGATLTLTTAIAETGGSFGFIKTGTGTLALGGINTYTGTTTISQGVLNATANSALGLGNVSAIDSTILSLGAAVTNAIADTATLSLAGMGATAAKLNLSATTGTLQETVGALVLGGVPQAPGTYGATGSGATNIDDNYFTGAGILTVVPEPSSWVASAFGAAGLLVLVRRRATRARQS